MSIRNQILSTLVFNITKSMHKTNVTVINMISKNMSDDIIELNKKIYLSNRPDLVSTSGNYYVGGVVFMVSVLGLLMYVNFYYENCFSETCYDLSRLSCCCCVQLCFKYKLCNFSQSQTSENSVSSKERDTRLLENSSSNTCTLDKIEVLK